MEKAILAHLPMMAKWAEDGLRCRGHYFYFQIKHKWVGRPMYIPTTTIWAGDRLKKGLKIIKISFENENGSRAHPNDRQMGRRWALLPRPQWLMQIYILFMGLCIVNKTFRGGYFCLRKEISFTPNRRWALLAKASNGHFRGLCNFRITSGARLPAEGPLGLLT